ncbi:HAD-IA family hydrolase [uncultured Sphingomonas sp.]|uniref:HAD-IA family hydrolase n=1 Tax=uncultured Sphingomonas sp. TaxID=158754 RepID=UPI0035CB2018
MTLAMSDRVRLAIFDCDGTLVDSQANICRAMEEAFARHGVEPPPRAAIRRIVGLSLVEAVRTLSPERDDALHRRLAGEYKQIFRAMRADARLDDEPLFAGMADALDGLRDRGWVLGVATGKSDRGLAHVLAAHGIADRFATLQTADRHPSKPDPAMAVAAMAEIGAAPGDCVMIGDTSFDMAMGRAAGVRAVGVAWGYYAASELIAAGADMVATEPSALPHLLEAG